MLSRRGLAVVLAMLSLAATGAGCGGDDDDTISTAGVSGATGVSDAGDVAADAEAKAAARTAQTVVETLAIDQDGSYAGIDEAAVANLEPSLGDANLTVTGDRTTYTITVTSTSGVEFTVDHTADGDNDLTCEPTGTGGCPDDGDWS
jgi:hypothetical protein